MAYFRRAAAGCMELAAYAHAHGYDVINSLLSRYLFVFFLFR
jgi:hypothetical protein